MKYSGFHRALEIDRKGHSQVWQIHLCIEIDMTKVDQVRDAIKKQGEKPPTYTAFVVKAIAQAIEELKPQYPQINSFLQKFLWWRRIHLFDGISAGCSTALDDEKAVVTGTVLEPQKKSFQQITEELAQFSNLQSEFVKETLQYYRWPWPLQRLAYWIGSIVPSVRYQRRGTFCLNPVGKFGADFHLSLPQTSSLQFGMGAIADRVIAVESQPVVRKTMYLTLSFDRRLMNGRPAGLLLECTRRILTNVSV